MLTEVAPGHTVEDVLSKTTATVDVAPQVATVDA
jgi:acyl CoA:acetate/3-ketoacid CoA transferase beta subunit